MLREAGRAGCVRVRIPTKASRRFPTKRKVKVMPTTKGGDSDGVRSHPADCLPLPFTCTKTASKENACCVLFGHVLSEHETAFVEVWALQRHAHVRTRADKTRYNKPWQNKADATSEYETNTQKTRQGGGFEFDRFESPVLPPPPNHPPHTTALPHTTLKNGI